MSAEPVAGEQIVTVPTGIWTTLPNGVEVYHSSGYNLNWRWLPDGTVGTMEYQQACGVAVRWPGLARDASR